MPSCSGIICQPTMASQLTLRLCTAGVSLLTSGGTGFNKGDALCILSAFIFGMHKFRTESVTQKFEDTQDLVAVQLAVLAFCSFLASAPALWHLIPNSTPGATPCLALPLHCTCCAAAALRHTTFNSTPAVALCLALPCRALHLLYSSSSAAYHIQQHTRRGAVSRLALPCTASA